MHCAGQASIPVLWYLLVVELLEQGLLVKGRVHPLEEMWASMVYSISKRANAVLCKTAFHIK